MTGVLEQLRLGGMPKPRSRPDPRPPRPTVDRDSLRMARLLADECATCRRSDVSLFVHHLLYGKLYTGRRSDEFDGLMVLCGDCHYLVHQNDERVCRLVGKRLPIATVAFIIERLGAEKGEAYLERRYFYTREAAG